MEVPKPMCLPGPLFKVQADISGGSLPASYGYTKWKETTLLLNRGDCNPLVTGGLRGCAAPLFQAACHASRWWWVCYSLRSVHAKYVNYYTIFAWELQKLT